MKKIFVLSLMLIFAFTSCTKKYQFVKVVNEKGLFSSVYREQEEEPVVFKAKNDVEAYKKAYIKYCAALVADKELMRAINDVLDKKTIGFKLLDSEGNDITDLVFFKDKEDFESNLFNSLDLDEEIILDNKSAGWILNEETDEMTDTKNIWKTLLSDNVEEFSFPYSGGSRLSIIVRYMKKYGDDVIIKISSGQIHCSEYNGTDYVTIRFDDGEPIKFYVNESSDGSSDCVFLRNVPRFIEKAKSAHSIKVQIPIYKEGNPIFTFSVDEPLTWGKEEKELEKVDNNITNSNKNRVY